MGSRTLIVIIGAAGRMGRTIIDCASQARDDFQVVGALESADHPSMGIQLPSLVPDCPFEGSIAESLEGEVSKGFVTIDFSLPDSTMGHIEWIRENAAGAVIGTTGFDESQIAKIHDAATKIPIVFSPNMSVGVNVLFDIVERAIKKVGEGFDIEIVDLHHRFKKDAPSGTARELARIALEARDGSTGDLRHGREGITGERTQKEIGIHALRAGDAVGEHTVVLAALGERLELIHRAQSRETFARGALRAAKWVSGRAPGLYTMKDVLDL